jgi:flagellar biosynthesis/type III secretory pathway protein FliH
LSANLIKKDEFHRLFAREGSSESVARFSTARAEVERLEQELAELAERSRRDVEKAREEARAEALRLAEEEHGREVSALKEATAELRRVAAHELTVVEQEVVEIALAVSAKILRREIARDGEYLPRLVRRCLRKLVRRAPVTIRLNPQDHSSIAATAPELFGEETGGSHEITLVADRRISRGGCVVETPDFVVDGTVGSQLATARKALREDGP